jgi:SAM-dependent methyltransferase
MNDLNSGQIKFWNSEHGLAWARYADTVDIMFAELSNTILDATDITTGDRVLDLGCGNGGTTLLAAERVTAIGNVTAIDVSSPMIDRARDRLADADIINATFILGDAATYPFAENSFDAIVSRLGCMFFEDPYTAFRHFSPSLDTGGRTAFAVWREPRENPWAMTPVSAAREFLEMPPRPSPEEPGPFSFADPDRVRRVLSATGWTDTDLTPFDFRIPLGNTLEDALNFCKEMGPLSTPLSKVTGTNRTKAIEAITAVLEQNTDDDGIVRLDGACWIVTAKRP